MDARTNAGDCLHCLHTLEPAAQAEVLAQLAQEARLVRLAVQDNALPIDAVCAAFERALEDAMDADVDDEARAARHRLEGVLHGVRGAGLKVSASLSELDIAGVLGDMKMPVLTTVLSAAD